jgi:alpha-L-fucosidase
MCSAGNLPRRIPLASIEQLALMGRWLDVNGESIYGSESTQRLEFRITNGGYHHTLKGKTLYVQCRHWIPGEHTLGVVEAKLKSARLLQGNVPVEFEQKNGRIWLRGLPSAPPDPLGTIIALEFDETPHTRDRFELGFPWWEGIYFDH